MSKLICTSAIDGAVDWVVRGRSHTRPGHRRQGRASAKVAFPDTAYYLPVIYSFLGEKVETLDDCRRVLRRAKELLPARPSEQVWLPYLGNALDAGVAALFACEIIEACKYLIGPNPVDGIWLGAANDVIMRERGIEFVDGTAPGFAAITGASPDQSRSPSRSPASSRRRTSTSSWAAPPGGTQFAEQLAEEGVQLGWETRLVPFGKDVSALIYALGFANRAALSFGGVKPGDFEANLSYNKNRIFAFVLALGEVDAREIRRRSRRDQLRLPVIADTDIPEILPTGVCTYEHVVSNVPHETMVEKALEVRGCKVKITKVPIPVPYGPAFEGERIRKAGRPRRVRRQQDPRLRVRHHGRHGRRSTTARSTSSAPTSTRSKPGTALPLAIWVEVAGRKMQADFEPILERQIHHLVNGAEGIWHMGQRDIVWTRVRKAGFAKGLAPAALRRDPSRQAACRIIRPSSTR